MKTQTVLKNEILQSMAWRCAPLEEKIAWVESQFYLQSHGNIAILPTNELAAVIGLPAVQIIKSPLFFTKSDLNDNGEKTSFSGPKAYPEERQNGYLHLSKKLTGRKTKKVKRIDRSSINPRSNNDRFKIDPSFQAKLLRDNGHSFAEPPSIDLPTSTSNSNKNDSTTSAEDHPDLPNWARDLVFPLMGGGSWKISFQDLQNFKTAHKESHIIVCCKKAAMWLVANPKKRKTAKGMPNFLLGWINRAPQEVKTNGGFRAGGLL